VNSAGLNIVVVGRNGQIAWELQHSLRNLGDVKAVGRPEIDLAQPESLRRMVRQSMPDVLINAAAYTAVDQAETDPDIVGALNAEAPRVMAEEAKRVKALFITYSSDYVFDGFKKAPYTEGDVPNPLNEYGASKLAGDRAVEAEGGAYLILRTSWVYGSRGKNFLRTIMKLATERRELRVVDDQVGAPTWSHDIATATAQILFLLTERSGRMESLAGREGVYNVTAQGSVSWYGFARAILDEMCLSGVRREELTRLVPIPSKEHPTAAARPGNSVLSNEKIRQTFGIVMPQWRTSLTKAMASKDSFENAKTITENC
jgi:dTDP-4-dehydrorhamnose reductase